MKFSLVGYKALFWMLRMVKIGFCGNMGFEKFLYTEIIVFII